MTWGVRVCRCLLQSGADEMCVVSCGDVSASGAAACLAFCRGLCLDKLALAVGVTLTRVGHLLWATFDYLLCSVCLLLPGLTVCLLTAAASLMCVMTSVPGHCLLGHTSPLICCNGSAGSECRRGSDKRPLLWPCA